MQNRYMTGKKGTLRREANGGIPLLTDLCLAMISDPLAVIR